MIKDNIPKEIFRAYDIRGIVGKQLNPELLTLLGRAYGSEMKQRGLQKIATGYDGRLSSPLLSSALIQGLTTSGIQVTNIGMVPTPCLYYAVSDLNLDGGIMITGSHNPPDYNGCKMLMDGDSIALERIQGLYEAICQGDFTVGTGSVTELNFLPRYIDKLIQGVELKNKYHIIVDSGNGVTGGCAPQIFRKLGCEVTELFCEIDGNFPNHHPDPGNPKNLQDIQQEVLKSKADIGYAFDGDGDRLGLISNEGEIIYPDRMMMLFAEDLLSRHPGGEIIFDVKCSSLLAQVIQDKGGKPLMWKTGHSLIKKKMKETGALLAGEMSGHIFFAENWPRSDDALLAGVRLLSIIDRMQQDSATVFANYPNATSTPEINLKTSEQQKFTVIDKLRQSSAEFAAKEIIEIDGLRVEYQDGWGLVRASNTSPVLVLRFEAQDKDALKRIMNIFHSILSVIDPDLDLSPLGISLPLSD